MLTSICHLDFGFSTKQPDVVLDLKPRWRPMGPKELQTAFSYNLDMTVYFQFPRSPELSRYFRAGSSDLSAAGGQAPKWGGLVPVEILEESDRAADLEAIRLTLRSSTRGFIIAAGT